MKFEEFIEEIKNGHRKFKIRRYIKPENRYRTSEGITDVVIELPAYDYLSLVRQAKSKLNMVTETNLRSLAKKHNTDVETSKKALEESKKSLDKTLTGGQTTRSDKDDYITLDNHGWVKIHKETEDIYFTGYKVQETVIKKAQYKDKNSRAKTLVKQDLSKGLPNDLSRWKVNKKDIEKIEKA